MAYEKLIGQGSRMIEIIPNDMGPIPFPGNFITSGTGDNPGSGSTTVLRDANATFITDGVKPNDIIWCTLVGPLGRGATIVKQVDSETQLTTSTVVNANFGLNSVTYSIWKGEAVPCRLWIAKADRNIDIITEGGDEITLLSSSMGGSGAANANNWFGSQITHIKETNAFSGASLVGHWAIW